MHNYIWLFKNIVAYPIIYVLKYLFKRYKLEVKQLVIKGSFKTIINENSFDILSEDNQVIMHVEKNIHIPNKLVIENPSTGERYAATLNPSDDGEEFILYEGETEIISIRQYDIINLPRFDIESTLGNFKTKPNLRNREITLFDGKDKAAKLKGMNDYTIEIEDERDVFYTMCVVFGLMTLLPLRPVYQILSPIS